MVTKSGVKVDGQGQGKGQVRGGVKVRGPGQGSRFGGQGRSQCQGSRSGEWSRSGGGGQGLADWGQMVGGGRLEINSLFLSRTHDRIEFHSIPFQSIPFHSIPFHSNPFHSMIYPMPYKWHIHQSLTLSSPGLSITLLSKQM